jgi:hypothetical protein
VLQVVYCPAGAGVCLRRDIGSAGLAFTREALADILGHVVPDRLFDWRMSKYVTDTKAQFLYALSPSMAEHVGAVGANGRASNTDRAIDFPINELDPPLREKVCACLPPG